MNIFACPQYTLVWSASAVKYYFDGQLVGTLNTNVPSQPSSFLWNSVSTHSHHCTAEYKLISRHLFLQWSGGNVKWTAGPPTQDAILRIKKIDLTYQTA